MIKYKQLNVKLDPLVYDQLTAYCDETGVHKNDLFSAFIDSLLAGDLPDSLYQKIESRKTDRKNPLITCPECNLTAPNNVLPQHFCFGTDIHESERTFGIYRYWREKKVQSTKHPGFTLTGKEMISLFDEAGISADDVGKESHSYQLARYGDTGPYALGNCRFITLRENIQEKKRQFTIHTPESREKLRQAAIKQWSNPQNRKRHSQIMKNLHE